MHVPSVTKAWGDYTTHDRTKRGSGRWLSNLIGCTVNIYQSATFCTPSFSLSESFSLPSPITFLQGLPLHQNVPFYVRLSYLCRLLSQLQLQFLCHHSHHVSFVGSAFVALSFDWKKNKLLAFIWESQIWNDHLRFLRLKTKQSSLTMFNCEGWTKTALIQLWLKMSLQLCNKQMKSQTICSIKSDVYITPIQAHMETIPTQTAGFNA